MLGYRACARWAGSEVLELGFLVCLFFQGLGVPKHWVMEFSFGGLRVQEFWDESRRCTGRGDMTSGNEG